MNLKEKINAHLSAVSGHPVKSQYESLEDFDVDSLSMMSFLMDLSDDLEGVELLDLLGLNVSSWKTVADIESNIRKLMD